MIRRLEFSLNRLMLIIQVIDQFTGFSRSRKDVAVVKELDKAQLKSERVLRRLFS